MEEEENKCELWLLGKRDDASQELFEKNYDDLTKEQKEEVVKKIVREL